MVARRATTGTSLAQPRVLPGAERQITQHDGGTPGRYGDFRYFSNTSNSRMPGPSVGLSLW
jgi:hypothetical protein